VNGSVLEAEVGEWLDIAQVSAGAPQAADPGVGCGHRAKCLTGQEVPRGHSARPFTGRIRSSTVGSHRRP